jgi:hypothetical protein
VTAEKKRFPASPTLPPDDYIRPVIIFPAGEVARVLHEAWDCIRGIYFRFKPHLAPAANHCHLALILVPLGGVIYGRNAHDFLQAGEDKLTQPIHCFNNASGIKFHGCLRFQGFIGHGRDRSLDSISYQVLFKGFTKDKKRSIDMIHSINEQMIEIERYCI